jgi:predicted TIM-barrel fold metal-dependent hydrolase
MPVNRTRDSRIIDFRCRPPLAAFGLLFDLKLKRLTWENQLVIEPSLAVSASMYHVGEDAGLDLLRQEMDEAGIDLVVAPGRKLPPKTAFKPIGGNDAIDFNVTDETLVALRERFESRLIGLAGIDLNQSVETIVSGIEHSVKAFGLRGIVLEPGYFKATDGSQLWADDKRLYPIYETAIALDIFVMHQSGIYAGYDFGVNHWPPVDRLLQDFPQLKFVLAHGGYPAVLEALALACKHPNCYLSPDIYCFFPGGELYVNSISKLPDQFVFASAYPFAPLKESVEGALRFPLKDEVMEKYLYGNAARLLKLGA